MSEKRGYTLRERAKSQGETRQKIVEAAMHLHEEIGARATTISAIAERAGVQRLTVYRHFPSEFEIFQACTAHWLTLNPPPESSAWAGHEEPGARVAAAVRAMYDYYTQTRRMLALSHRDVDSVPALQQPMAELAAYIAGVARELAADLAAEEAGRAAVAVTLAHALQFPSWESLEGLGLDEAGKVELVRDWLRGALARK